MVQLTSRLDGIPACFNILRQSMKYTDPFLLQLLVILCFTILLGSALFLLSIYKRLFLRVSNAWLRQNLVVMSVAILFLLAFLSLQSHEMMTNGTVKFWRMILKEIGLVIIIAFVVFNVTWLISRIPQVKSLSFFGHHVVIILTIVISAVFMYALMNYLNNGMKFKNLQGALSYAYFNSIVTGLVYTAVNYVELDRKRKMNEKELELSRLRELKTKAELDALHSKVNPHFLYNALNSIADLSITDGKKARKMTVALADLFRYSINYSNNNYTTVKEEAEMAEVYLLIEKIRFEDKLNYTIKVDQDLNHYLVPRFLLQPIVENAVKHGLKATGQMTEINLEITKNNGGIMMNVVDTGPAFPAELNPGYGVKSVFDKLDLLFPGQYEILFNNVPRKQVSIHIHKLMKNEPGI